MTWIQCDAQLAENGLREASPVELAAVEGGFLNLNALPLIAARLAQLLSAGTAPYRPTEPR